MSNLTKKQENQYKTFAQEYIKKFNGTDSAILAGYSKNTATVQASRLLTHAKVQEFIQFYIKEREERTEVTSDMVVNELAKIAFMQETDFYDENGNPKLAKDLTDSQRSALKSYRVKTIKAEDGQYEDIPLFTAHDKVKTLELLAKHLGMFTEKIEHSGVDGNPIETKWTVEFVKAKDESTTDT